MRTIIGIKLSIYAAKGSSRPAPFSGWKYPNGDLQIKRVKKLSGCVAYSGCNLDMITLNIVYMNRGIRLHRAHHPG